MRYTEHFLLEAIRFAAFAFACGSLMRFRFSHKTTGLLAAGFLAGILALQAGLLAAGLDETLVLTLLPVTAYVPAILAVHVLSGSNFLQTASVWSAGILVSMALLFLQRLLNIWLPGHTVLPVLAAALVLSGLVFRFSAARTAPMCWKTGAAGCCWVSPWSCCSCCSPTGQTP